MKEEKIKKQRRNRRLNRNRLKALKEVRLRSKVRLSVFRSNKHFYAQIIDDIKKITLVSVSEKELDKNTKITKIEKAAVLGGILAKKAKELGITEIVFDKGSYRYHGRVKNFAEGARKEGLSF